MVVNGWSRPDPHIRRCFDTRIHLLNDSGPAAYVHAQPLFLYPAEWISANTARLDAEEPHHIAAFPARETMLARIEALLAFDIDARLGEIEDLYWDEFQKNDLANLVFLRGGKG